MVVLPVAAAAQGPVCVLVPHFKDEYWLSVGFGLEQEAARAALPLRLYEAGGYEARDTQIAQIDDCIAQGGAAMLIGAVSSDHKALLAAVGRAAAAMPVIGLVNELHADSLSGTVGVDWHGMGWAVGAALAARFPAGSPPVRAVFLSGPAASGWVAPLDEGLRAGLGNAAVTIIARRAADTGLRQQFAEVAEVFASGTPFDILIGPAPAIEAAMGYLANHPDTRPPLLVASYVTHSIRRGLADGKVAFAPFDDPIEQGRMALRMAVARMAGPPKAPPAPPEVVGPPIVLVGPQEALSGRILLSPPGYFPHID